MRSGIGRIEVIVLVLVALALATIGVVAMRYWRESAARVECMAHLKEIGTSLFVHQDKTKHLPASRLDKGYATWAVQLAPYLPDAVAATLRPWDLNKTYYAQTEAVRKAQVRYFYCPARRLPPKYSIAGDNEGDVLFPGALGDYACCSGDGSVPWDGPEANGLIIPASVLKRDGDKLLKWELLTVLETKEPAAEDTPPHGQSSTIAIGEKHVPYGEFGQVSSGDGSLYNGDHLASAARVGGPDYPVAQSIDEPVHDNFGSYHPTICHFLMADGGVRALNKDLSPFVLGKLTVRGNQ